MNNQENQQSFSILIDFEATGVDPKSDRVTEIGAVLVETSTLLPLKVFSSLVYESDYKPLDPVVQKLTNITDDDLKKEGKSLAEALTLMGEEFMPELHNVDYVVAYNKDFDENIFKTECERTAASMTVAGNVLFNSTWLCAMRDVETNYNFKCWKLSHLAIDRGVEVNPKNLHRAVDDVLLMRRMLLAADAKLSEMSTFQTLPWVYLQAQIPAPWVDGGKGRDQAKALGYSWEKCSGDDRVFEKTWVKRVKEHKVGEEIEQAPFRAVRINQ